MAANSPSSPPCIDCAAKGIVLHSIARQPLSYNTDTGAGLYAGILAHVSVSNPVPVGSTIYGYTLSLPLILCIIYSRDSS